MVQVEHFAHEHSLCPNVAIRDIWPGVREGTANALVRRGLAEGVECELDGIYDELRLTDAGRSLATSEGA